MVTLAFQDPLRIWKGMKEEANRLGQAEYCYGSEALRPVPWGSPKLNTKPGGGGRARGARLPASLLSRRSEPKFAGAGNLSLALRSVPALRAQRGEGLQDSSTLGGRTTLRGSSSWDTVSFPPTFSPA